RLRYAAGYAPSWFDGYEEEGYAAYDDVDGDVTAEVRVEDRGDERIYTVTDAAGNEAHAVRRLPYSIGCPLLTLNGEADMQLGASFHFEDPGFTAVDARGNDLSAYVQQEGEVVPYASGDYALCYSITNAKGERVQATRQVHIVPLRNPDTVEPGGKVIYLTFDDGPGPYTDRLLDILGRYNVKATFFVTCRYPDNFDCIGRAFREGHSIGVHSASHNYFAIYASEAAFFEDFDAVEDLIYEQTGCYTRLCRFHGGSSNMVSRFNRGIMSRLTQALSDMGYQYFDWNVSSGDAGETTSTAQVTANIMNGCAGQRVSVVLQHDLTDFSVAAVEQVLVWGLNNGYTFAPLDETSPPAHHSVAN
ncbi:MAG: polysaccharide deacetylase, partial [Oscillospiraceae bacterium]|nr:polysaccharide deacetylase [Oscillospiraceae bacterium]